MTETPAELRARIELCLGECVEMSNWMFDEQRFALAEQWHLKALEWQQRLDALTAPAAAEA